MEYLKKLVRDLSEGNNGRNDQIRLLQQVNEAMLKRYQLSIGGYLFVQPLEVEIFYVNRKSNPPYVDTNMHCLIDPKMESELWQLQSARFGQLYYHLKGTGGIDVCLSDSNEYALCCTIKSARINDEEVWRQSNVRNTIVSRICEHDHVEDRESVIQGINSPTSLPVLSCREHPLEESEAVYHTKRKLRRTDKNSSLPLHSFTDVWNKKLLLTSVQRITLYMKAHPEEDVMEVMRQQGFHAIPGEIRMRYNISRSQKL